jgi:hypothetical protein
MRMLSKSIWFFFFETRFSKSYTCMYFSMSICNVFLPNNSFLLFYYHFFLIQERSERRGINCCPFFLLWKSFFVRETSYLRFGVWWKGRKLDHNLMAWNLVNLQKFILFLSTNKFLLEVINTSSFFFICVLIFLKKNWLFLIFSFCFNILVLKIKF